ncbi:MAG TPA: SRPBCC domain-containing protein [Candidatus Limnocylindrales bacterium]
MELSGRTVVAAPRSRVWQTVIDPRNVAACAPGLDSIEAVDERHFRATARVRVAFFTVGLTVELERLATQPMDRVELAAHGDAAGSRIEARGEIRLGGPDAGPTTVDWRADLEPTGAVASLGEGVLRPMATKLVDDGIACLKARLEAGAGSEPAPG